MNRFLKALSLVAIIAFAASCKKDDGANIAPPRDYGVQDATDKVLIENFLKSHYVTVDPETFTATFDSIKQTGRTSIWDQTEYPLKSKIVKRNDIEYTVYYLSFREGVGDKPTMADNINFTFRGTLLNGTQFDYREVVSTEVPLSGLIKGFWDVMPEFGAGVYQDINPGEPAKFTDYGAGAMFLPSGLAYFNGTRPLISPYSCLVFTFQLMDVTYTDVDGDGILNRYEVKQGVNPGNNNMPYTVEDTDTDNDDIPDYLDTDDDGDGRTTKEELRNINPTEEYPNEFFTYDDMYPGGVFNAAKFSCSGTGTIPKYLDNACQGGRQ